MDTKDKTPPIDAIEPDLSAEEKAIHDAALKRQHEPSVVSDEQLPKVSSEQSQ